MSTRTWWAERRLRVGESMSAKCDGSEEMRNRAEKRTRRIGRCVCVELFRRSARGVVYARSRLDRSKMCMLEYVVCDVMIPVSVLVKLRALL